ncbi:MAG: RluA family pseudouridine synthase [Gemmatimonadetes bacterium]|uniref:Pseudouridine synthase n=1 Tax=Candidatus Kutchimonas denitrificans TaxID=3056748 RepID=A0AAE5CBJ7_9BACT|nr:RluA family pseudouridine synthase [Gemmatimonadota bacterium]NIR74520.1 RluA family pseudouridine synthase [Candidatus Kutchimonas denitrificans]NIS02710.1 RluA family pseudouridine synthase [Gemmatimonadota bacterium]NIT68871.1 RluA family pseudouridine synthase [Gemmatimonadota bacterium]NIU52176.1 RluA family pseudouridine synthase [Gemmatimonadota bacterium]
MKRIEDADGTVIHTLHVDEPSGERLDRYLAQVLSLSRSQSAALIEAGNVKVNGQTPKKSHVPAVGDEIVAVVPPPDPLEVEPEPIPVEILYEDDALLVVNKPAGMVVHPAPGHSAGTLVNALLHHAGSLSSIGGSSRPGVVHRLDKDTSGLIIVARDESAHRRLSTALARRRISRSYLAACWGHLPQDEMVVEAEVGRHRRDRKRMAVVPEGRPAITELQLLERWRAADLLSVRLGTGRTHQIRVHLLHIGHPVVGDRQYAEGWERGMSGVGRWARDLANRVPRQFLHATELRFRHPLTGRELEFVAPLPEDLAEAAEWARRTS